MRSHLPLCGIVSVFVAICSLAAARADVQLPAVFREHMVLQRDLPLSVWGSAQPGEKVTVEFAGQSVAATADGTGHWLVKLAPLAANATPQTLTVSGRNTLKIADVLVGEVWLGSGQSNMTVGSRGAAQHDPTLAKLMAGSYPRIRIHSAGRPWTVAASEQVNGGLPALPLAFALRLQEQLQVPVGMLVGAVPGSSTDFWLTPKAIAGDETCRSAIETYAATEYVAEKKAYEARLAKWEQAQAAETAKTAKPQPPREPGSAMHELGKFYERDIRPFIPYAIRGVLWDQGENYASVVGTKQTMIMGALIASWRKDWGQGEFPWIYVQKPSGGGCAWDPSDPVTAMAEPFEPLPEKTPGPGEGRGREDYLQLMQFPRTYLAMASDLGAGVHPKCKSGYGARAARVALGAVYGRDLEYLGPLYAGCQVEEGRIRVRFTHVGKGLAAAHSQKLQGFMIAGEDRKFVWADATIEQDTVVVSAAGVAKPVAVRYAWAAKCAWANLFNQDGLPAQAFRTDSW